jgi:hypothetical protein
MAQIIKNRRGSLDRLSSATGSLQKGEILIATGSSKLTGVTNGQGLVFAAVESGSVVAANRVLQGATAPIFSASSYGNLLDGVPFYASSSNTLFLLGADGNTTPDLTGNISTFSSSVATSFSASAASIASVTGDFSSSVATSFSASNASVTALSASTYEAVFGFAGFSSSVAVAFSQSAHSLGDLSGSVATTISNLSSSLATTDSASAAQISALSASVASVTGDFSSSVATSFSASAASQTALSGAIATTVSNLSSSIATTDSASAAFAASQLSSVSGAVATTISNLSSSIATTDSASAAFAASQLSAVSGAVATSLSASAANVTAISGAFATSTSASNYQISELSASVASVGGTFSSSVATDFSASTAERVALSASIAVTDNAQSDRLSVIESTYATTGSNTFTGNQIVSASVYVTGDMIVYGSSSFQNITASAVSIGTNTVILSTATPAVRFGGISVIDSGSSQTTGSLFWDSQRDHWVSVRPSSSTEVANSAVLIYGPKNTGSLGDETLLTTGKIMVALGEDHIGDSIMTQTTGKITLSGSLDVTGEISSSTISGIGNVTAYSTSVDSRVASLESSVGAGGAIGTRVSNLETISSSYLAFTQSYYSDSSSFDTRISASVATATSFSASAASELSSVSGAVATSLSASKAEYSSFSASAASGLNSVSGAFATSTSASNASIASLSASVASVTGDFSSSVATSFSASAAERVALSASIASTDSTQTNNIASLTSKTGSYATTGSNIFNGDQILTGSFGMTGTLNVNNAVAVNDSNMNLGNSSSLNLTGGSSIYVGGAGVISGSIVGIGNVTTFSTSVDSRLDTIETSLGGGGSLGSRVAGLEALTGSYATTGSNVFKGEQIISSSLLVTNEIKGTGSIFLQPDSTDSRKLEIYNTSVTDVHIKGTGGLTFLGDDTNYVKIDDSAATITIESTNGVTIDTSVTISAELSASTINGIGNVSAYSSSVDSRFSASVASVTALSASVASVTGDFSSSVATSFSASAASVTLLSASVSSISGAVATSLSASAASVEALSASIATTDSASAAYAASQLSAVSGAFATSTSASNAQIAALSASVASTTGDFSSSVDSRLDVIESKYATTGSNSFTGSQGILGDVKVSGSVYIQFGQDLVTNHISGNQGKIELGNIDNNVNIIAENELRLTATGSGVHVHNANFSVSPSGLNNNVLVVSASQTTITNELSASNISGVGNIGAFSQSVDSRLVTAETFKSNIETAIQLTGSNVTVQGDLLVRGTTTSVNSTTIDLGDNIINLNGTGATNGGLYVKDVTNPNTATGSLLWDSTNDYWKAGVKDSESKVLLAVGDNVFSSSIQTALSGTFGYTDFSSSIVTSFSASNANIASLSASVASVTGDFSSSVATSFSASNASIASLSASVASVTGDFSSSVATSFSASAASLTALSASIYQTDATQSTDITNNSSSFATSISASNFRITVLETTIDGGSF